MMTYEELLNLAEREGRIAVKVSLCERDAIALQLLRAMPDVIGENITVGETEEVLQDWIADGSANGWDTIQPIDMLKEFGLDISDNKEIRRVLSDTLWWLITLFTIKVPQESYQTDLINDTISA